MRSIMSKSAVVAGAFLLVAGAAANAAASDLVAEVKVPFSFVVNGRSLPAGQYMVERDDLSSPVLLIRGEKGTHAATFVSTTPAGGQDPAGTAPVLTFTRHENQYRLSSVWESGSQGWNVTGQ
jgi:hypothetical protein